MQLSVRTAIAAPTNRATLRKILLVLGTAIGLATGFAGLYFSTIAIFLKPIAVEFGWNRADTSAAIIMSMLGLALGSPLQGLIIDRIGARRVIAGSVVLLALTLLAFAALPNNHLLFAVISLAMGMLTVASGPNGYLSVLPKWFDRRLGLALGFAMVGVGIGAATFPALAQSWVTDYGWRNAYRFLAVVVLVGGAVAWSLLGVGKSASNSAPTNKISAIEHSGMTLQQALRDQRFWLVMIALAIGGAGGLGIVVHLAAMLDDRGFTPAHIARVVGCSGVGLALGRFAAGALMDFLRAPLVGATAYALGSFGMGLVGLGLSDSLLVLSMGALLIGTALGAEGDFAAFVVRRYFGMRAFAAIYGCVFMAYSLGGVCGPILFGALFDRHGNYLFATGLGMCGWLLAATLVLAIGQYRYAASDPAEEVT